MSNMHYLLNIGVSGIKSIKDEVRLEFYKKTINKDFEPDKYRIKAIYGENGSGKSAIITAIKIFQDIMIKDQYLSESKNQHFLNEIINKTTQHFHFWCEYLIDLDKEKLVHYYSIEIGRGNNGRYEIKHELLKTKSGNYSNNNYKTLYESKDGELVHIKCAKNYRTEVEKKMANLLSTSSFNYLYIVHLNNINLKESNILAHIAINLMFSLSIKIYMAEEDQHELYFLRKKLREIEFNDGNLIPGFNDAIDSINDYSGVNEKLVTKEHFDSYKEKVEQLTRFIQLFKKDLISIDIDSKENGDQYECELNMNYGSYRINKEFESTGIKKLIRLFDCFTTVDKGGIVFIDEMDSNLNDVYLCKLIEYFMYYSTGQLCFTTHNLDPMSVLKENKNSIDFLSSDNKLVSWTSRGNATPENCYKNGMIEHSPFNIDATDFVGMFGE
ncbi:MAG: AAA family ATPase [Lachnospiraceae bacterium]|nr:AAA family ATPase [Lachnospiraceae bacterium]